MGALLSSQGERSRQVAAVYRQPTGARATSRLATRKSGTDEILDPRVHMKPKLLVHLGFDIRAMREPAPQGTHSRYDAADHWTSCGVADSARAISAAKSFQLAACSSSRRRPAADRR